MFRKPRGTLMAGTVAPPLPAVGRPPTPPFATCQNTSTSSIMAPTAISASSTTTLLGRSKALPKRTPVTPGKGKGKANGNIMSFFKKADTHEAHIRSAGEVDGGLFVDCARDEVDFEALPQIPNPPNDYTSAKVHLDEADPPSATCPPLRYNEDFGSVKRRKIDDPSDFSKSGRDSPRNAAPKGPFLDDSEDDTEALSVPLPTIPNKAEELDELNMPAKSPSIETSLRSKAAQECFNESELIALKRESTDLDEVDDFEGVEDFVDDEFPEEGEEYLERRWMEAETELGLDVEQDYEGPLDVATTTNERRTEDAASSTCPMCGGNTNGMTEQQVSLHVNDCLDGKAPALSPQKQLADRGYDDRFMKSKNGIPAHKRFQRAAIPRPGQENPFSLAPSTNMPSSAFSKLMSGHAEDTAWATAAAAEVASRGKPAYQRTCPFYKIMPGFFICVDAFRYGAVEGCNAYFLSHFHSDHYIGLTSSWCHGPIYCSNVTANLVRRQLRVDPKWVVNLQFENQVEVPNTHGVYVTMIPANHCPGSSLFLFEKTIGKGKAPKIQRVLHCGDFRACPAHVQHPKLRPELFDHISGKLAQQKLDVCYLDTTYLTPKYAFPSQEEVIKACGDMCVSLSKDFVDESDGWEQVKKERGAVGMVKFARNASVKDEVNKDWNIKGQDESESMKKRRGRLLVVVGTYSIGKERICLGVAKALNSKIYAPANKQKVVAALEDPELSARMTDDPLQAQVHMQMLMEIRAETLADYLTGFKPHFSRIVGFRPSGWNYRPPNSRFTESPSVQTVLHSDSWKSRYSMAELVPQRGSTREANCFGVPYSEHSSFRELTMFCCALRIDKIIPTVNVGSAKSREKMKAWCDKWAMEKKKNGLYKVADGQVAW
ncbi:MAG: hypothetical protein Q9163_002650 [Psora crenata]